MSRQDALALTALTLLLLLLALAAGPKIAVGLILALPFLALIFARPIIGVGLMILSGTALQVLGSEHLTGLPMSLGKLTGIATLAAWLARRFLGRDAMTYSPQLLALAGFLASLVVAIAVSPDKALAQDGLFRYAQLLLLYFMIMNLAGGSRRALDATLWALSASMVVSVLIGLAEFYLPSLALEDDDPGLVQGSVGAILDHDSVEGVEIKRITGGLSDSNWFAYTLAGVIPINLYLFHRYRSLVVRGVVVAAMALQSFGVVLSLTRTAIFALGVSVLVLMVKRRLPVLPILLLALAGAVAIFVWNPPGLQRIFSVQYLKEGSTPLRAYLLRGGISLILQRPILGYGYSEFGPNFFRWLTTVSVPDSVGQWAQDLIEKVNAGLDQYEWVMPHNTILQIWVEYGLLGIVSFGLFCAFVLRDLAQASRAGSPGERLMADCLAAATWGFFVCALFGHLAMLKIIWILAGLAAALRRVVFAPASLRAPRTLGRSADPEPAS